MEWDVYEYLFICLLKYEYFYAVKVMHFYASS